MELPAGLEPQDLRIAGPQALIQAIPYLLGFHPQDSLVLVGLAGDRLVVTARTDLSTLDLPTVRATLASFRRGGVGDVVAIVFDGTGPPRAGSARAAGLAELLVDAVAAGECRLLDVLAVGGGRWLSVQCRDRRCCPEHGQPLDGPTSVFAAAATVRGVVPLADRAALEQTLDPEPIAVRTRLLRLIRLEQDAWIGRCADAAARRPERGAVRELFATARRSAAVPPPDPRLPGQVARFGVVLRDRGVRDPVWLGIDDGRIDGRALWRELARRLPDPFAAAPLFLFGWAAWRDGDGALAAIAVRRCLDSDAGYSAARLLETAIEGGINPAQVPRLRGRARAAPPARATRTRR